MHWWNRFEQFCKRRGLALLEKWLAVEELAPEQVARAALRRILVIRQHDYLGDFLLATPVLRALREHFPHAHLGVLVRRYTAEVARHNQYVDEVLVFEEHGWNWTPARLRRLWRQLRQGWDLAIVLNTVSHSLTSDVLARFSRARYCLGSAERVFPGCSRNFFYHLSAPPAAGRRHQTDRNLDIVRVLGIDTSDHREVMTLTPADRAFAAGFLARHGISPTERIVALHLGAGKRDNRWPPEKFAAVANALHRDYRVRLLAAWGPQEGALGEAFLRRLAFSPVVVKNVSLRQLAALLAAADGYVCNDTGVMHVGAAVGVPLVAIFGPTDPALWKPPGEKFIALRGHNGECANVEPEQVLHALLRLVSPPLPARDEHAAAVMVTPS
ncbi:MAG: glycosyltransferase family 9 protein [candidate division KSB1 bacterium]|nr:glycosyltransferase family 9 protein [candidate division KSB1 bacterium]MDZ7276064.1 glycosyltransferase family 9 protein [candidate division KSB1 bacterium]MDZ7285654.1 glycosyltransferase family 9 protein [candidate division KSB1 bacterium]MDZ7298686.1 glycosyltransferase family 9 protein [candidate division KSB1 bacterium]MDZ7308406.1 glycosyltransferase family 9 protein [candidate division KSB1 bacterium]